MCYNNPFHIEEYGLYNCKYNCKLLKCEICLENLESCWITEDNELKADFIHKCQF